MSLNVYPRGKKRCLCLFIYACGVAFFRRELYRIRKKTERKRRWECLATLRAKRQGLKRVCVWACERVCVFLFLYKGFFCASKKSMFVCFGGLLSRSQVLPLFCYLLELTFLLFCSRSKLAMEVACAYKLYLIMEWHVWNLFVYEWHVRNLFV